MHLLLILFLMPKLKRDAAHIIRLMPYHHAFTSSIRRCARLLPVVLIFCALSAACSHLHYRRGILISISDFSSRTGRQSPSRLYRTLYRPLPPLYFHTIFHGRSQPCRHSQSPRYADDARYDFCRFRHVDVGRLALNDDITLRSGTRPRRAPPFHFHFLRAYILFHARHTTSDRPIDGLSHFTIPPHYAARRNFNSFN